MDETAQTEAREDTQCGTEIVEGGSYDDAESGADDGARWSATDALMIPAGHTARMLGIDDVRQIVNAAMFASWRDAPFLVCMTIRWDAAIAPFDPSPTTWLDRQGRLFERMTRWLERNRIPVAYAWVREVSRNRVPHTHVYLCLPHARWQEFRSFMLASGAFRDAPQPFDPIKLEGGDYGTHSLSMRAGKLKYLLKGLDPREGFRDPVTGRTLNVGEFLRVDNRGEDRMPLVGKRCGVSRTIDRQARLEAGWRELTTLRDLYRALNP